MNRSELKYTGRVIYEDDRMLVEINPLTGIDHDIFVRTEGNNFAHLCLGRGMLNEWARAEGDNLLERMQSYSSSEFLDAINRTNMGVPGFGWRIAKAVIADMEYMEQLG